MDGGVELIELCGGFGVVGLAAMTAAVSGRVPVGAVFYGVDASAGLQRLFAVGAEKCQRLGRCKVRMVPCVAVMSLLKKPR